MTRLFKTLAAGSMLALAVSAVPALALDAQQKKDMGEFIREYLLQNPEILLDVQDALQAKQQAQRLEQANKAIAENRQAIFFSPDDVTLGNPNGDVTVVEFFDYNCGFCKRALADMEAVIAKDKNVRFVLKEFPVLGPDSVAAHHVAYAVRLIAPEKYGEFHRNLLGAPGHASAKTAIAVAVSLGISEDAIRKSVKDNPADGILAQTELLAQKIGITGTPSYVIGDELIPGAQGADVIEPKIANLRTCGKATC